MADNQTISEPLLLSAKQVSELLGLSRSKFYEILAAGRCSVPQIRFGRCVRWRRDLILKWIEADCTAHWQPDGKEVAA
jgi:excisionase family DNA binding protein